MTPDDVIDFWVAAGEARWFTRDPAFDGQLLVRFKETLAERVMTAMEAIDAKGGDRRCSCASDPKASAACETRTAHVAYILAPTRATATGNRTTTAAMRCTSA